VRQENFEQSLSQVLEGAKSSKLDQRIVKNVNFNDEEVI
jgi:hypothetical protein